MKFVLRLLITVSLSGLLAVTSACSEDDENSDNGSPDSGGELTDAGSTPTPDTSQTPTHDANQIPTSDASQTPAPSNPVFNIPDQSALGDGEIYFLAEIYAGSTHKNEFRTATGSMIMDRVVCPRKVAGTDEWVDAFPANYGISPARFNVDGDPLDVVVMGAEPKYEGQVTSFNIQPEIVRVVGIMKMEECDEIPCLTDDEWANDWKILGVDPSDPRFQDVQTVEDIADEDLAPLMAYWSNYKGPVVDEDTGEEHPQTRVDGYITKETALTYIADNFPMMNPTERTAEVEGCHEKYAAAYASRTPPTEKDGDYLDCVQRVYYDGFKPGSESFDFFVKHNGVHWALKLKLDSPNYDDVFDLLQGLKDDGETYYRFVGHDRPSPPGTGLAIFEWVKTKNRNRGCPDDFPSQHYEGRPVDDSAN